MRFKSENMNMKCIVTVIVFTQSMTKGLFEVEIVLLALVLTILTIYLTMMRSLTPNTSF